MSGPGRLRMREGPEKAHTGGTGWNRNPAPPGESPLVDAFHPPMAGKMHQSGGRGVWRVVSREHGVVSRAQLLERGLSPKGIEHRIETGRLFPVHAGVYAVGRP